MNHRRSVLQKRSDLTESKYHDKVYNNYLPKKLNHSNSPSDYSDSVYGYKKILIPSPEELNSTSLTKYFQNGSQRTSEKPQQEVQKVPQKAPKTANQRTEITEKVKFVSLSIKSMAAFEKIAKKTKKGIKRRRKPNFQNKDLQQKVKAFNNAKRTEDQNNRESSGFGLGFKVQKLDPSSFDTAVKRPKMNFFKTSTFPHIKYDSTQSNWKERQKSTEIFKQSNLSNTMGKSTVKDPSQTIFEGFLAGNEEAFQRKTAKGIQSCRIIDFCPNMNVVNGLKNLISKRSDNLKNPSKLPENGSSYFVYTKTSSMKEPDFIQKGASHLKSESALGSFKETDPFRSTHCRESHKRNKSMNSLNMKTKKIIDISRK
ncbi:unnamed protein product [Moneuplotes crassus]|uniref:Uncharacterized protein n=1 Tax=Euplotes crassus TaxID=5936 RepID=A0AAD1XYQ4_EUPCR|nr:unnamed protein product [Moneuplotes crassus]